MNYFERIILKELLELLKKKYFKRIFKSEFLLTERNMLSVRSKKYFLNRNKNIVFT